MQDLIRKKRDGLELSSKEIQFFVDGLTKEIIPDYQVSAFLMAVYFKGMTRREIADLTEAMMNSGDLIDLSKVKGIKVDKHSTGGVGDKTTLILAPLVAAAGVPIAKMSGRGLGHTGGTLDKLESIPGFRIDLTQEEFIQNVIEYGVAVNGQTGLLVPADKKLYALRDVTATVESKALITSSIMSKKLACGSDAIVIDLKLGNGAYIHDLQNAEELGNILIETGAEMGKKVVVVITAMDQPLGRAVGNALEVKEALDVLKGEGPQDVLDLCLNLGAHMLLLSGKVSELDTGRQLLLGLIENGQAHSKFREMVIGQGGDPSVVDEPNRFPIAKFSANFESPRSGYVSFLSALDVGRAAVVLGAGREDKNSVVDLAAGIYLEKKVGDHVEKGEVLARLYSNDTLKIEAAQAMLSSCWQIETAKPIRYKPLIIKTLI